MYCTIWINIGIRDLFRPCGFYENRGREGCTFGQWRTQEFFSGGGVQQIQLRTEDRENGDLGA